jgi:hypothetical protein
MDEERGEETYDDDEEEGEVDDGGWANLRLHLQIEHPLFRFLFHECESASDADSSFSSAASSSKSASSLSTHNTSQTSHRRGGGRCYSVLISLPFASDAERGNSFSNLYPFFSSPIVDARPPEIKGPLRHVSDESIIST